jgi:hypothetical protein
MGLKTLFLNASSVKPVSPTWFLRARLRTPVPNLLYRVSLFGGGFLFIRYPSSATRFDAMRDTFSNKRRFGFVFLGEEYVGLLGSGGSCNFFDREPILIKLFHESPRMPRPRAGGQRVLVHIINKSYPIG